MGMGRQKDRQGANDARAALRQAQGERGKMEVRILTVVLPEEGLPQNDRGWLKGVVGERITTSPR